MVQRVSTNNFACAKWIVDANGVSSGATHSTIAGAIGDAVSGETILVKPGTYTENLTLKAGVTITGMGGDGFTPTASIVGKCSFTATGQATLDNLFLQTNSDFAVEVSGTNDSVLYVESCFINCTNNTGVSISSSGTSFLYLNNCHGTITTDGNAIFNVSSARFRMFNCFFSNTATNTTANTNSGSELIMRWCRILSPINITAGNFSIVLSEIATLLQNSTCLTTSTASDNTLALCRFLTASSACLTINGSGKTRVHDCVLESSNANTIDGTGTIHYGSLQGYDVGTNMTISTTTQVTNKTGPRILLSGGAEIISGSGSPNTVVTAPQGSLFLRTDGTTTNDRAYINTDGSTAWTAITTVA